MPTWSKVIDRRIRQLVPQEAYDFHSVSTLLTSEFNDSFSVEETRLRFALLSQQAEEEDEEVTRALRRARMRVQKRQRSKLRLKRKEKKREKKREEKSKKISVMAAAKAKR